MSDDGADTPGRPRHMASGSRGRVPGGRNDPYGRNIRADGGDFSPRSDGSNAVTGPTGRAGGEGRYGRGDARGSTDPTGRYDRAAVRGSSNPTGRAGGEGPGAASRPNGPNHRDGGNGRPSPGGPSGPNGPSTSAGRAAGEDDEADGAARRRWRGLLAWPVPVLLGVFGVAAGIGAVVLNRDEAAVALEASAPPATPVLSARRAPEMIAAPVADRRLAADLQGWVAQSPANSCLVVEASGDDPLYAHNPTLPLAGASTQKLLTATALLLAAGPDDRFETVVGATVPVSAGVVAGDLFLVGGGDPLLATPAYASTLNGNHGGFLTVDPVQLADAIAAAGVTRIDGSIVGDDSRYDQQRYHPAWPARYRAQAVIGPVSALTINDGFGFYFDDGQGAGPTSGDPATDAAAMVTQLLRQRGVVVAGEAHAGQAPAGLTSIATFPSATVRELVAEMLTDSDNDTAEMALKEIGARQNGSGSWEAGAAAATALLSQAGVSFDGVSIVDGSGLSENNRLTCQLLVDLLTLPDTGPVLVDGLAVAGETGTLTERWDGTPVEGRLRAKTGTLNTVTALSGRVDALQGGTLTFSYVLNVPQPQTIQSVDIERQTSLADILVSYPRGVDTTVLLPAAPPAG
jgi:D-alanyl-D-alanine carboxypeptidase/D-alanyl-D-alanine-endopeptidase (penicillin-binding protein 4)